MRAKVKRGSCIVPEPGATIKPCGTVTIVAIAKTQATARAAIGVGRRLRLRDRTGEETRTGPAPHRDAGPVILFAGLPDDERKLIPGERHRRDRVARAIGELDAAPL